MLFVDFDKVVIEHKQVNGVTQIFNLLAESKRQTGETAVEYPVGQVGPLNKAGANPPRRMDC